MGDAIRSVFSCTLLVIFSLSLFIWGFLVNRRRAWRLDGGTAVFGSGALGLALVTTASSFVAVKEERIDWLQHLIWAAVLWQTWLGWWWWVGAGMGIGEVEDIMERTMRKRRKAARREHSRNVMSAVNDDADEAQRRPQTVAGAIKSGTSAVVGFTSSLAHLRPSTGGSAPGSGAGSAAAGPSSTGGGSLARIRRNRRSARARRDEEEGITDGDEDVEAIELGAVRLTEPPRDNATENGSGQGSGGRHPQSSNSNSETSSTSRTPSLHAPRSVAEFVAYPATWLQVYIRRLRKAHEEATRRRAVEQAERRARVPTMAASADDGWGLGAFGVREHQESTWRLQEADRQLRVNRLLEEGEDGVEEEGGEEDGGRVKGHRNSARGSPLTSRRNSLAQPARSFRERERLERETSGARASAQAPTPPRMERDETEWEDVESDSSQRRRRRSRSLRSRVSGASLRESHRDSRGDRDDDDTPEDDSPRQEAGGSSWSWWGPLREWRLQDRSTF